MSAKPVLGGDEFGDVLGAEALLDPLRWTLGPLRSHCPW